MRVARAEVNLNNVKVRLMGTVGTVGTVHLLPHAHMRLRILFIYAYITYIHVCVRQKVHCTHCPHVPMF